jgi:opacity protein-like surface antigen
MLDWKGCCNMKRLLGLFTVALMMALPAFGQVTNEMPRIDLSGGFTHMTGDIGLNGWDGSATYRINRWLGLAGDLSGLYGSNSVLGVGFSSHLYNLNFGPRVFVPLNDYPKWKPFGELLLGFSHQGQRIKDSLLGPGVVVPGFDESDTSFSWMIGGGIDYQLNDNWRIRALELDLLRTKFLDTVQNRARFNFGVVYQFGQP